MWISQGSTCKVKEVVIAGLWRFIHAVCIYIYIYTYIYIYIYIKAYVCMYVCMYTHSGVAD